MMKCDCNERIGVEINSFHLYEELKEFFDTQVHNKVFDDIPVKLPYFNGYNLKEREIKKEFEHYADKWYKCKKCGTLWEFKYPDFPAKGFVRKFSNGEYYIKE